MGRFSGILVLAFATAIQADDWPSFRNTGSSIAQGEYPLKWSAKDNLAWKVDLPGYGQSSPVVWNGTIYVTAVEGEQREKGYVLALEAKTGKEKWRHTFEPTQKAKWSYTISRAAPTPCADRDGVYCFVEGGNVLAFTHEGKLRWERTLTKDYGEFQGAHGVGSSPAQTSKYLFILIDHRGPSYLLALDKATGKTAWKTAREAKGGWASPVVARVGEQEQVIASNAGSIISYAADTGKSLWNVENIVGNTLPSASVFNDLVLFGGGMSRSKEGPLAGAKSNGCLKLTTKDGVPTVESVWTAKMGISNYATPLAYEGTAYFVNQVGVVFAYDLATGKELFNERIDGPCWASPVGAGKHVYFFGKDGTTNVLKGGAKFDVVATNKLWESKTKDTPAKKEGFGESSEPTVYGVAAVDGAFYIRTGQQLFCVRK